MNAWLRQHHQALTQTIGRFAGAPLATLANILVIGVVMSLPLGAYSLLVNLQSYSGALPTQPQISLFMAPGKSEPGSLEPRLKSAPGVQSVRYVSRDSALAILKRSAGVGEIVASLKDNPLPDAYIVTLRDGDTDGIEDLEKQFRTLPGVAHVQVDSAWVRRMDALLRIGRTITTLLGGLLSFALLAVTFNTIRLQIVTQHEEIEVSRLLGATDAFIRRPFYYLGSMLGGLGAGAALAVLWGSIHLLNRDLVRLGPVYGIQPNLDFLTTADALAFLAFGALLGWLGSFMSVSKYLYSFEPH